MEEAFHELKLADGTVCRLSVVSRYRNMQDTAVGWKRVAVGSKITHSVLFEFTITAAPVGTRRESDALAVSVATPPGYSLATVNSARNVVRFVPSKSSAVKLSSDGAVGAGELTEWLTEVVYEAGPAPKPASFALRLTEDTAARTLEVTEVPGVRKNVTVTFVRV